jgi:hypothetical protein
MSDADFLHREAETGLCEYFVAVGALCSFSTNCEQLLSAARETFQQPESASRPVDFSLRFWVDGAGLPQRPWPKPYVRGLGHLVFAGFDAQSSILANLRTRRVVGRFSRAMSADSWHWKMVIFPVLLSILAGSVGLVELHASCVARGGNGLILTGPSRSGKSTLALALTHSGFSFLSDDRTFCSLTRNKLLAWGLPRPLKLRRDAASWFEELRHREPIEVQDGERVFDFEPSQREPKCEPRLVVFLERQPSSGFRLTPMKKQEARSCIEKDLLAEAPEAIQKQVESIDKLLSFPCFRLRYGGLPQVIAKQLATAFANECQCRS